MKLTEIFKIPEDEGSDITKLLKTYIEKATGPDTIPPKLVKLSANNVDLHFYAIQQIKTYKAILFQMGQK